MLYEYMYIKSSLLHRMKTAFVPPMKPTENIYTARSYIFFRDERWWRSDVKRGKEANE